MVQEQNMTQEELNAVFSISLRIFEDPWFKEKARTKEEVQDWVRHQLASLGNYTVPVGSSWGVISTEENYDKYLFGATSTPIIQSITPGVVEKPKGWFKRLIDWFKASV